MVTSFADGFDGGPVGLGQGINPYCQAITAAKPTQTIIIIIAIGKDIVFFIVFGLLHRPPLYPKQKPEGIPRDGGSGGRTMLEPVW